MEENSQHQNQLFKKYLRKELEAFEKMADQQNEAKIATLLLFVRTAVETNQVDSMYTFICSFMDKQLKEKDA